VGSARRRPRPDAAVRGQPRRRGDVNLKWPHRDGLSWPHSGRAAVGVGWARSSTRCRASWALSTSRTQPRWSGRCDVPFSDRARLSRPFHPRSRSPVSTPGRLLVWVARAASDRREDQPRHAPARGDGRCDSPVTSTRTDLPQRVRDPRPCRGWRGRRSSSLWAGSACGIGRVLPDPDLPIGSAQIWAQRISGHQGRRRTSPGHACATRR
jgi:hypothetical protein